MTSIRICIVVQGRHGATYIFFMRFLRYHMSSSNCSTVPLWQGSKKPNISHGLMATSLSYDLKTPYIFIVKVQYHSTHWSMHVCSGWIKVPLMNWSAILYCSHRTIWWAVPLDNWYHKWVPHCVLHCNGIIVTYEQWINYKFPNTFDSRRDETTQHVIH